MKNSGSHNGEKERLSIENDEELFPSFSLSSFQAREEEIERKKMEMREKVEMQLGRAEEQSKRLSHVWEVSLWNKKIHKYLHKFGIQTQP